MLKPLGKLIKAARENAGVTQRELADAVGIKRPYVSQLETGHREPSLDVLQRIAEALGCELVIDLRCHADEKKSRSRSSKSPRR